MTITACQSNQVMPFITLLDGSGQSAGLIVDPEKVLNNLTGGDYTVSAQANPDCIWQVAITPVATGARATAAPASAARPFRRARAQTCGSLGGTTCGRCSLSSLTKWHATGWSGCVSGERLERRLLGGAALRVAQALAQPAAGVEAAAAGRVGGAGDVAR